jgi:hypothetical protein
MSEQVKSYITTESFKLLFIILPLIIGGLAAWSDMRVSVAEIDARVVELQRDSTEIGQLTAAVRDLTVQSARLEERLKTLDSRLSNFERTLK